MGKLRLCLVHVFTAPEKAACVCVQAPRFTKVSVGGLLLISVSGARLTSAQTFRLLSLEGRGLPCLRFALSPVPLVCACHLHTHMQCGYL